MYVLAGADVTVSGSYLRLSEGGVDVGTGATFTIDEPFQGKERAFPLVKTGGGDAGSRRDDSRGH